jgi:trans-aconitate methyltransferase
MPEPTRWHTDTAADHSQRYVQRFRDLAAEGVDLSGEARLLDALVPPGSWVLDAGCGPGRVGAALHARGHRVIGVDVDPVLIDAARADHPGPHWYVADLTELDLPTLGHPVPLQGVVMAGNVMVYLAAGTEATVLERLAGHLASGGVIALGFTTERDYSPDDLERDAGQAGLVREHRFATWDLHPWRDGGDFLVAILRRPATS